MENVIYVSEINSCLSCGCMAYDPDIGCTIPLIDHWYACPLAPDPDPSDFIEVEESEDI